MGEDRIDSEISPVKLVVIERTGEPKQFKLTNTTTFTTGNVTQQEGDTIVLDYPFLDQVLGRIEYRLTNWVYHDLSDETETYVNGENVATNYEHTLQDGDVIKVTSDQLTLVCVFRDHYSEDVQWERIDLKGVGNAINLYGKGAVAEGDHGVVYDDDKHHVVMKYNERRWEVQDVNTSRGVYINRQKIEPNHPTPLNLYDVIVIGDTIFVYQQDQLIYNAREAQKKGAPLAIHIEERTVWNTFKKKTLLKDIHLQIESGDMVLILGGSGAGKTTFINAVTGYEKAKAQITEGDKNVYRDYDQMKYEIGFVPQQDLLRGDDDVRMTLMNSAETRMPEDTPVDVLEERVDAILRMFGLDTVQNDLVEKLSGGQRKRLSIAVEFMADPKLFILDEPDSGLDGVMARDLMTRLRKIADQGRIVMVITHTPDRVIDLFDKVVVLAKDRSGTGRLCYFGPIQEAKSFFGKDSMEEIVLTINREDEGGEGRADEFIDKFRIVNHEDDAYDKEPLLTFEEIEQREAAIRMKNHADGGVSPADEPTDAKDHEETKAPLPHDESLESRALRDWDEEAKARDELNKPAKAEKPDKTAASMPLEKPGNATGRRHSGRFNQVRVYLGKFFRIFIYEKDWKVISMAALIAWVVAFVVGGSLFRTMEGTTLGALAMACVCIWNGFFNSIQVVCRERAIIKREHRSGLHMTAYVGAQMIYQAFICLCQVLILLGVLKVMGVKFLSVGVVTGFFILDMFVTCFLITYSADMLALMVSCIVRDTTSAMTVMPMLLIVELVFSGVAFPLGGMAGKVANLTISKWGIYAICTTANYNTLQSSALWTALNKVGGSPQAQSLIETIRDTPGLRYKLQVWTGQQMQNSAYLYTKANVVREWGVLALMAIVAAAVGIIFLEFIDHDKR